MFVLGAIMGAFRFLKKESGVKGMFLGFLVLAGLVEVNLSITGFKNDEPLLIVCGGLAVMVMAVIGVKVFGKNGVFTINRVAKPTKRSNEKTHRPKTSEEFDVIYEALDDIVTDNSFIDRIKFEEKFLKEPILLNIEAKVLRHFYDSYMEIYSNIKQNVFLSFFHKNASGEIFNINTFRKEGKVTDSKKAKGFEEMKDKLNAIKGGKGDHSQS